MRSEEKLATRSVLIVDDDRNLTKLVSTVLALAGLNVLTASDGLAALNLLNGQEVDVIILDLRMPRMDGRTFLKELREKGKDTPVLIASAYGARAAQRELGAQAAIEKPFDPQRLLDVVTELLA
ncbi:MAG TPA: response regulator [Dehalococcoidia bacterium]|nr:response regulator [Dehalococcoidia bacterium]